MKTTARNIASIVSTLLIALSALAISATAHATLIYQQDFTGDSRVPLTGTKVGVGDGFWSDQTGRFKQDGSIPGVWFSSLTLPFTPSSGYVYTLQATLEATTGPDYDQLYTGFFNSSGGDSTTVYSTKASMMGVDQSGHWLINNSHEGTTSGPLAFKIVLDTTGTNWMSKFYVNDFYVSWKDQTFTSVPTITTVGFGTQSTIGGNLSAFSLEGVAVVPEPSTYALILGGIATLLVIRRRVKA
jgi:hypothetical protein